MSPVDAPAPSRGVQIAGVLVILAVSGLAGFLLAEIGLRLFSPQIYPVHPPGMYSETGRAVPGLTPGFSGRLQRAEFDAAFSINSSGFRGAEPSPRRDNTVRIVALGDSQTFGFGVEDHETFAVQLEGLLAAEFPGLDVQVVNTGTPGYGTYAQLEILQALWPDLDPDIVLLQFLPANDFEENRDAVALMLPRVRDGMLTEVAPPGEAAQLPVWLRVLYWSKAHSHFMKLLSESAGYAAMRLGLAQNVAALWGEDFSERDAELTGDLLVKVAETAQAGGAQMLFLYSTAKHDLMSADYAPQRSRGVIESAAGRSGAAWIDVNERMLAYAEPHRFYFVRDGHWSPAGHRAVAEIVAAELRERDWMTARDDGSQ
jgi:hypothetical protein